MQRDQHEGKHEYLVSPNVYDVSSNNTVSTYDQFIQLRDTLVYTGKKYKGKGTRKLCIGDKEETVEVREPNIFKQTVNPGWDSDSSKAPASYLGKYITAVDQSLDPSFIASISPLCCQIQKDGFYRIVHKQEILPTATTEKVFCYVDIYRKNEQGVYEIPYKGGIAVYDWAAKGTLTGTTSGTSPNGSCSVPFKLGQIFQKMTAFGYMERDLYKGDILVLRMKDGPHNEQTGEPTGNNLPIQSDSNYWNIEYLDLLHNI